MGLLTVYLSFMMFEDRDKSECLHIVFDRRYWIV